jgi:hypothetical protein
MSIEYRLLGSDCTMLTTLYYQAWENAKDKEESKNLIFEDVNGSPIQTMIHQNDGWSPVGRTATIASLRKRSVV